MSWKRQILARRPVLSSEFRACLDRPEGKSCNRLAPKRLGQSDSPPASRRSMRQKKAAVPRPRPDGAAGGRGGTGRRLRGSAPFVFRPCLGALRAGLSQKNCPQTGAALRKRTCFRARDRPQGSARQGPGTLEQGGNLVQTPARAWKAGLASSREAGSRLEKRAAERLTYDLAPTLERKCEGEEPGDAGRMARRNSIARAEPERTLCAPGRAQRGSRPHRAGRSRGRRGWFYSRRACISSRPPLAPPAGDRILSSAARPRPDAGRPRRSRIQRIKRGRLRGSPALRASWLRGPRKSGVPPRRQDSDRAVSWVSRQSGLGAF